MDNPAAFERFVRGIPTDMPPFAITEITKLADTSFSVFLDFKPELRADLGLPETSIGDESGHDFHILVSYHPQTATLGIGVYMEVGIPLSAYGWTLARLNSLNKFGSGYMSKIFIPDPDPGRGEDLLLMFGWDTGLYDASLLEGEGLKFLTTLIHSSMHRICVESSSIGVQLTQMFHADFPAGSLNS